MKRNHINTASKMWDIIKPAPMSPRIKDSFIQFRDNNDTEGMYKFFNDCIEKRGDVGKSIQSEGKHPSFEQLKPQVDELFSN